MTKEIHIDLAQTPANRWHLSPEQQDQAKQLLDSYVADLGDIGQFSGLLLEYAALIVRPDYFEEIKSLAALVNSSVESALLATLYYDAIKTVLGCTAFAVDTPNGPLHARNLDWWTENAMLNKFTVITNFRSGPNNHAFKTVGWPGYVGALSGVAPNRFAITLNAVLSDDPPAFATPISLFIRTVFENATTYAEAVDLLTTTEIASDCLLLITGTQLGEMAVIERTPTRSAVRHPQNGFIAVANEYIALDKPEIDPDNDLLATSGGRYARATQQLGQHIPTTADDCLAILRDPDIQMGITVQQMVFSAAKGEVSVWLPKSTA